MKFWRLVELDEEDARVGDEWYCEWDSEWKKMDKRDVRVASSKKSPSRIYGFPIRRRIVSFIDYPQKVRTKQNERN